MPSQLKRPTFPEGFPADGIKAFADELQDYFNDDDPLYEVLVNGPHEWQQIYTLGLEPVRDGGALQENFRGDLWRVLAGSPSAAVAAEVGPPEKGSGPWEVMSVSTGMGINSALLAVKEIDGLAASELGADTDKYEL